MLYLNEEAITKLQPTWEVALDVIEKAIATWSRDDYAQPIKPYLRYNNLENRIIAMPAFLGKPFEVAGLKWIASFPSNVQKQLPRAHSLTILNDSLSGKQIAIINSSRISGIRTAAVSGVVLRAFVGALPFRKFKIGIIGFGPIGKLHLNMVEEIVSSRAEQISIYDVNETVRKQIMEYFPDYRIVNHWQEAYRDADILITCTTSSESYIDELPKKGSLHLNVSLRDYHPEIVMASSHLIVDDWEEVCRENTDIERAHKTLGLEKHHTVSLKEISLKGYFESLYRSEHFNKNFVMFHPMGMALFDLALAKYYYDIAIAQGEGVVLDD